MLPRQRPWLFPPKRTPTLTCNFTLTTKLLRGCPQQNFLGFWSLTASPGLFTSTIYVKKLVALLVLSIGPSPVLSFAPVASFILQLSAQSWNMGVSRGNTTLTNRLEACQRFAARVILQSWNLSHEDLLQKSNLPLLSKRMDYATLCHLYKILHHLSSSPNSYNPHPRTSLRNLNSRAIVPSFCRLTLCQKSFYPSILMLLHSGITSLRTLSNSILCSPSSQPSVPILASQFLCFAWCLFFLCFWFSFLFFFFFFWNYFLLFWCFWPPFNLLLLQYWVVPGLWAEWYKYK